MLQLYDFELSADCYKLRLLLAVLQVPHEVVPVDVFPGREQQSDWFLAINPAGTVPFLVDDGFATALVTDGLRHLADKFDASGRWAPVAHPSAALRDWLAFSRQLAASAGVARTAIGFGWDADLPAAQNAAHRLLRDLDEQLWFGEREGHDWLSPPAHPTVADLACFAEVVLCEEGGVSRQDYPAIRRWLDRVKRIAGFIPMSGVFPAGPAA